MMNKIINTNILFAATMALLLVFFTGCKKENTPIVVNTTLPSGTTLAMGTITSNAHTSIGLVTITKATNGKIFLNFENFKTDNGPDLRIYLSPNLNAAPYIEVGNLIAINGNFTYELPVDINYTTNNKMLIWCKDFSVLFGHAILQ
jgi:hypothetical protein